MQTPGPRISRNFTREGAAVSFPGYTEIGSPPGVRTSPWRSVKADLSARTSPWRSGKADLSTRTSARRSGKADLSARSFARRSGKADPFTRTFARRSGEADPFARTSAWRSAKADLFTRLWAARPGFGAKTARFLITREGSKFYETATKGDFFVATSSPLVNLLFCPRRAKLWLRRGKTPPRNPAAPRGLPNDRDRPPAVRKPARAPKPGDPAPACLLEKALWVPPTTDPFRWAPGGKPEKGKRKGRRNPRWHDRPRFAHARSLTTTPPDDGWEGSQPKRTKRRGKPAKKRRRSLA